MDKFKYTISQHMNNDKRKTTSKRLGRSRKAKTRTIRDDQARKNSTQSKNSQTSIRTARERLRPRKDHLLQSQRCQTHLKECITTDSKERLESTFYFSDWLSEHHYE